MQNINITHSLIKLGTFLKQFKNENQYSKENLSENEFFFKRYELLIAHSHHKNGWFTPQNILYATREWAHALEEQNLNNWLSKYSFKSKTSKNVGLVLAGNIPLVGFHDILCVLISGNKAIIKTSSQDHDLISFYIDFLIHSEDSFKEKVIFTDKLENYDAVIATGSNNTARYFEYYFKNKPNIIRKNRNSVAVLSGNETLKELIALGEDIFTYFGLGCRNVSKIMVPKGYDFTLFFEAIFNFKDLINYQKYAHNYDYNKAVFLMSLYKIYDNGFIILKEDKSYSSPIASLFYEFYDDIHTVKQQLALDREKIQCVVSHLPLKEAIPFGETQKPRLWDYADGIDTLQFLNNL